MQRSDLLKKRAKEAERKKAKPSVYDLPMFKDYETPGANKEKLFNLKNSQKDLNKIFHGDSRDMKEIEDSVVSLIVCSPPYNVNKNYSKYDDQSCLEDYLDYLDDVWRQCERKLRPGGRLCVNVANIGRRPYLPLTAFMTERILDIGFHMRGQFIWDKGASVGVSTAWGSYKKPSNPTIRDLHEYILVFSKTTNTLKKAQDSSESDIEKDEFIEYGKSIWSFSTANPKKVGHPAPFPLDLPLRCIKFYTYPGDLVLDPFCGSGTTCLAAKMLGRYYIGYDIDKQYVDLALNRIESYKK